MKQKTTTSIYTFPDDRGVSLLELAIILPVVLLLIAAIVDFGFEINAQKQIVLAASQGARVAASHPRRVLDNKQPMAFCSDVPKNIHAKNQAQCPGTQQVFRMNDSVARVAHVTTCNTLNAHGIDTVGWNVVCQVENEISDGAQFSLVRVDISRKQTDCVFCYANMHQFFRAGTSSQYVLEEPCR